MRSKAITRKEFLTICGLLGVTIHSLIACDEVEPAFKGKVLIIGAGAGGLSAAYLLKQQDIDFEILEASPIHGGRMKINSDFADFPIPLGAEWIETEPSIFNEIVNDPSVQVNIQTISDSPDFKFVNFSWNNFFEQYIVPSISSQIRYNTVVNSIDYRGDKVIVNTKSEQIEADKVIIALPLKILQDGDVKFFPNLPAYKQEAINKSVIWPGFKAFIEFSSKFYEDEMDFKADEGHKIYYNASFGQKTSKHILGLFVVGTPSLNYTTLSESELKAYLLNELDTIYNGQASENYINHITQNWSKEPFIKAAYLNDNADWRTVRDLGLSVDDKVYFAGGAYTDGEDWVSVHTAAKSAKSAVREILNK